MSNINRITVALDSIKAAKNPVMAPVSSSLIGEGVGLLVRKLADVIGTRPLTAGDILNAMRAEPIVVVSGESIEIDDVVEAIEEDSELAAEDEAAKEVESDASNEGHVTVGVDTYQEFKDRAVGMIVEVLRNNIDIARNDARPVIDQIVSGYPVAWSAMADRAERGNVSFVPVDLPPIWSDPDFLELLHRYGNVPASNIELTLELPFVRELNKTDNHLSGDGKEHDSFFNTGVSGVDAHIHDILENIGRYKINDVLNRVYGGEFKGGIYDALPKGLLSVDQLTLLFLFTLNIANNTPDQFFGVNSLGQFNNEVNRYLSSIAALIRYRVNQYDAMDKQNRLVIEAPSADVIGSRLKEGHNIRIVQLHSRVYQRFIEMGGTDAAIGGYLLGKRESDDFNSILERKEVLERRWNTLLEMMRSWAEDIRLDNFKSYATNALKNLTADEASSLIKDHVADRQTLNNLIDSEIAKINPKGELNIPLILQDLVLNVFYAHTAAPSIIRYLEQAGRSGMGENSREFALIGTIDYLASWAVTNIGMKRGSFERNDERPIASGL